VVFAVLGNSSQQYVSTDFLLKFKVFQGIFTGFLWKRSRQHLLCCYWSIFGGINRAVTDVFLATFTVLLWKRFMRHLLCFMKVITSMKHVILKVFPAEYTANIFMEMCSNLLTV
jgi:hypothetical protein